VKGTELIAIKKHLVRTAAVGALGVTAVAGFVAPASAASVAAPHLVSAGVAVAAAPNSNIQGSPAKWSPTKLSVATHKGTKCTTAKVSFTITNKTKKAQAVQEKSGSGKTTIGTVKPGKKAGICVLNASSGAKGQLYIKGSKSVLIITVK
jgi:hypothetical protein